MIPNDDITYILPDLENSGNPEMNVDGTINKIYKYQPPSDEIWLLDRVTLFILDSGDMNNANFGSIAALTNGIRLRINTSEDFIIRNIKDNVDILMAFSHNHLTGSTNTGFLSEEDYYLGSLIFPQKIRIDGSQNHNIKVVIRDDLRGIGRLKMNALLWKPT